MSSKPIQPVGHERWPSFPAYRDLPIQKFNASDPYHAAAVQAIHSGRPVPLPKTVVQHAGYIDLWHPWADPKRTGWQPRQDQVINMADEPEPAEMLDESDQERLLRTLVEDETFRLAIRGVLA